MMRYTIVSCFLYLFDGVFGGVDGDHWSARGLLLKTESKVYYPHLRKAFARDEVTVVSAFVMLSVSLHCMLLGPADQV